MGCDVKVLQPEEREPQAAPAGAALVLAVCDGEWTEL